MKCLAVVSHPLKNSLCKDLLDEVADELERKNHEIRIKDLYEEAFDPVLTRDERASYYGDEYTPSGTQKDIEQLCETEYLVLIFPTWWFGLPAILKGWLDRVWVPGAAYAHSVDNKSISPKLNALKKVRVITTLGSPWWVDRLILRQPVKKALKYGVVGACSRGCDFEMLSLYDCENLTQDKINRFKIRIRRFL
ncbi:NAD(P)H-dependent oxidoreductase [Sneathiella sp.]|uniref:NAD(P)H-dependent oxidoreductase n=1 Tax=Sneathiella sp. TaxID=1964365 RepID=UPI0039E22F98